VRCRLDTTGGGAPVQPSRPPRFPSLGPVCTASKVRSRVVIPINPGQSRI
jgi:hypothetical protein